MNANPIHPDNADPQRPAAGRQRAFPTFSRIFNARAFRIMLFGLAALATLVALLVAEENWRGQRAWKMCRRDLEARGEKLELAAILPPAVPPEQNFAQAPVMAQAAANDGNPIKLYLNGQRDAPPVGSWRMTRPTDLAAWQTYFSRSNTYPAAAQGTRPADGVLFALSKFETSFQELHAASRRPYAQFPVDWRLGFFAPMPHLGVTKNFCQALAFRASARLAAGQPDGALEDLKVCFRLADALRSFPNIISHLVRLSILQISVQPIWEGLNAGQWQDTHLAVLQKELWAVNLPVEQITALRGERAFANHCFDLLVSGQLKMRDLQGESDSGADPVERLADFTPKGLLRQNQLRINRYAQEVIDAMLAAAGPRGNYQRLDLSKVVKTAFTKGRTTPYNLLAKQLAPAYESFARRSVQTQAAIDLALVGCALERHRLAHKEYPAGLEALVPGYLERVPQDAATGGSLVYRRGEGGRFLLYSAGENQKDDGGKVVFTRGNKNVNTREGDWVWRYTTTQ